MKKKNYDSINVKKIIYKSMALFYKYHRFAINHI